MQKENKKRIDDVWLKASVLGSIWAASEIIIGSFLHNLRIPFVGIILASIGLVLLISAAHIWKDKGLFWRAGLICALMKTISPSAMIFSPMIAIFMESLLFEISVRLVGRNIAGFIIGSVLAMSWILVHQVVNLIILYGFNIVDIYFQMMKYTEEQLGLNFEIFWLPVLILLGIYSLFGIIAAIAGIVSGRKLAASGVRQIESSNSSCYSISRGNESKFEYSIIWLIVNIVLLPVAMIIISRGHFLFGTAAAFAVIAIWTYRYKSRLKQLMKPHFWIFFIIITMLAAISVTYLQDNGGNWEKGIMLGLKMNFRAAVVIAGFAALGTELFNPVVRRFFIRMGFRQLPLALEMAFESLPDVVRRSNATVLKKPFTLIRHLFSLAEIRFADMKKHNESRVFIVTGAIDSGKSTFVKELILLLRKKGLAVAGFYSEKLMQSGKLSGYDLVNTKTGERVSFLKTEFAEKPDLIENKNIDEDCCHSHKSRFIKNANAFEKGISWLDHESIAGADLVVIDEVGKWELSGSAWASSLDDLLGRSENDLLLVVRDKFLDGVISKWHLQKAVIIDIASTSPDNCVKLIAFS